jgi:hypothetical protein
MASAAPIYRQNPDERSFSMANITRFDPFNELAAFRPFGDMDSLFKGLVGQHKE